ncbi:MAG TPA: hypothetical protein PKI60_01635 [Oscillospiraceae bacterium]|nr:hypothetical protein [Oscillospiraceae bacterium]
MGYGTEKDPVFSDKLYKRGSAVFIISSLLYMTLFVIWMIMVSNDWEILIGEKILNHFFIIFLFLMLTLIGIIINLVACKRNKSKYTSQFIALIIISSIMLIGTAAFSISSIPISSSYEDVNLPNDKNVTLIWEEHSYGEYLYVCDVHGVFAKKVAMAAILDHNYDYKFDYDESDDTYSVTTYHENSNGQIIPSTDKFKLK